MSAIPVPDPVLERKRKLLVFDEESFRPEGRLQEVDRGHFVLKND